MIEMGSAVVLFGGLVSRVEIFRTARAGEIGYCWKGLITFIGKNDLKVEEHKNNKVNELTPRPPLLRRQGSGTG